MTTENTHEIKQGIAQDEDTAWRELWEFACDCISWGESTIDFEKFKSGRDIFDIKLKPG